MPYYKAGSRRQHRYELLRADGFLAYESRPLSKLPMETPALQSLRHRRREYLKNFVKEADRKDWTENKGKVEYRKRIRERYEKNRWVVQHGPTGKQRGRAKGALNPWAMYRDSERSHPAPKGKGFESPWEKKKGKKSHKKINLKEWLEE